MISSIIVIVCVLTLVTAVSIIHRRSNRRNRLLRIGCFLLLIATLLREASFADDWLVADLLKRLTMLALELVMILLVLSFHPRTSSKPVPRSIWFISAAAAIIQVWLYLALPRPAAQFIRDFAEYGGPPVAVAYHGLYLVGLAVAAAIVALFCGAVVFNRAHYITARIATGLIMVGVLVVVAFAALSWVHLINYTVDNDTKVRNLLFLISVACVFAGLAVGGFHRGLEVMRQWALNRSLQDIVGPLWRRTTSLHPGVVLPLDQDLLDDERLVLTRRTIEVGDALALVRGDPDDALAHIHNQHPEDPELTAALLLHLTGPDRETPVRKSTHLLLRVTPPADPMLHSAVIELCKLRTSMNNLRLKTMA